MRVSLIVNGASGMYTDEERASTDWPSLVTRILHDLVHIVQTEIRICQAQLEPILFGTVDRCLASVAALTAFIAASLCLLGALELYLSRWLGWPGSLVIAATMSFVGGLASLHFSKRVTFGRRRR